MGDAAGRGDRARDAAGLSAVDRCRHRAFAGESARPCRAVRARRVRPGLADGAAALPRVLGTPAGAGVCVLLLQALPAALGRRRGLRDRGCGRRVRAVARRGAGADRRDREYPARDHRRLRARPPGQAGRAHLARARRHGAERAALRVVASAVGHDRAMRFCPARVFDAGAGRRGGDDGADLSGAAAAAVSGGRRGREGARRSGLGGDERVVCADIAVLSLRAVDRAAIAS